VMITQAVLWLYFMIHASSTCILPHIRLWNVLTGSCLHACMHPCSTMDAWNMTLVLYVGLLVTGVGAGVQTFITIIKCKQLDRVAPHCPLAKLF
jgi:hypothetical protein